MNTRSALILIALATIAPLPAFGAGPAKNVVPARPTKVRDALRGEAREAFDRASELFSNDNFAAARTEFERAQELSSDPRIFYNVAVCDKSLNRYSRAMTALEKSLALGGDTLPKAYVDRVKDALATLTPFVSTLDIRVSEVDAKIYVDDELVGNAPLSAPIRVDVGDHLVGAKKTGFLDEPRKVRVTSGAPATLDLTLEPQQRRADLVVVAPNIANARVLVDGIDLGPLPFRGVLEPGKHAVTVRAPGHKSETRVVEVAFGKENLFAFTLAKEAHEARLRVNTSSDRDIVSLDGRVLGKGGFFGSVPAGEHTIRVSREDAQARTIDLLLREDETRSLDITLDEKKSGIPTWLLVAGGVAVAGAATTTAVVLGTQPTKFEGSAQGTLQPGVTKASFSGGMR